VHTTHPAPATTTRTARGLVAVIEPDPQAVRPAYPGAFTSTPQWVVRLFDGDIQIDIRHMRSLEGLQERLAGMDHDYFLARAEKRIADRHRARSYALTA
jgi:hypothetical protein